MIVHFAIYRVVTLKDIILFLTLFTAHSFFSQYGSVSQRDLWQFLTEAGHKDGTLQSHLALSAIMDSWIRKEGYPVIKVVKVPNSNSASVYQVCHGNKNGQNNKGVYIKSIVEER